MDDSNNNVNELVDSYNKCGFKVTPIPLRKKCPTHQNWNTLLDLPVPPGHNVGILHTFSRTMALDVDDYFEAIKIIPTLESYFLAPDAVHIFSGNPGHCKLLYKVPAFLGNLATRSIKVNHRDVISFRMASKEGTSMQDVLPPSIHPDTLQPYQWRGAGHYSRLPDIPASLLKQWQELLIPKATTPINIDDIDYPRIESALNHIDPNCGYAEWVSIGMALHSTNTNWASQLWDKWSSGGREYDQRETATKWRSFKNNPQGVTINTLFHLATKSGWMPSHEHVAKMFGPIGSTDSSATVGESRIPDIDLDIIPDKLRRRVEEIALHRGCDPLVPFMAGLAAVCGAVDKRSSLTLAPGYSVHPILWLMTIGDPGDKKTPGSKPMLDVLHVIEKQDIMGYARNMSVWSIAEKRYYIEMGNLDKVISSPDFSENDAIPKVNELPPQPVPTRLVTNDVTSQKLVNMCAPRPRGMLAYVDEMSGWFDTLLSKNGRGGDRSTWIQAYEGGTHSVDRITTGSQKVDNFAVAIYGNIQPDILYKTIADLSGDGFVQRFIPGILRSNLTVKGRPSMTDSETLNNEWTSTLKEIFGLPTMNYQLSGNSYTEFDRFQDWFEDQRCNNRTIRMNNTYMQAFSKLEGTLGRVALVFHLLTEPYNIQVSESTVKKAIRYIKDYVNPAMIHTYVTSMSSNNEIEEYLAEHIINISALKGYQTLCTVGSTYTSVSMQQLRRKCRQMAYKMPMNEIIDNISGAMDHLAGKHWVKLTNPEHNPRNHIWIINPELVKIYEVERIKTIRIKQERMDTLHNRNQMRPRKYVEGYREAVDEGLIIESGTVE